MRIKFNISWIYFILLIAIGWMFFIQGGATPQKEERADVQKQWLAGDIKEVVFIRNEYEGRVTMRPERIEHYADKFGVEFFPGQKPWGVKADIIMPCATQNEVGIEDAKIEQAIAGHVCLV